MLLIGYRYGERERGGVTHDPILCKFDMQLLAWSDPPTGGKCIGLTGLNTINLYV